MLTRDRGLLKRKKVTAGLLIRSSDSDEQVREVLHRLDLKTHCRPFSRCLLCAGLLKKVRAGDEDFKKNALQIPPKVLDWCDTFNVCLSCGKIYWEGSHYRQLSAKVAAYLRV